MPSFGRVQRFRGLGFRGLGYREEVGRDYFLIRFCGILCWDQGTQLDSDAYLVFLSFLFLGSGFQEYAKPPTLKASQVT